MQLNCETDELRQMALLMVGEKINTLEQRIAEQEAELSRKDERIAELELGVRERDDRIEQLQSQIMEMSMKMNGTVLTTWALQQYLVLSQPKATVYVRSVDNRVRAQIGQFLFQALPDNAPPMQLDYVREVTQPEPPIPTIAVGHADVAVGLAEDGAKIFHHYEQYQEKGGENHGRE